MRARNLAKLTAAMILTTPLMATQAMAQTGFFSETLQIAMAAPTILPPPAGWRAPAPTQPASCKSGEICRIGLRSYRYQTPEGWDGKTPLPVLIHYHGRKRNSAHVLRNPKVADPAHTHGALLVAPDGIDGDWAHQGDEQRDVLLTDLIVADLQRRLPINRDRVILSGFSNGGAMAARVACARGDAYFGYLPIAGDLRTTEPTDCVGGPARVLQVHGRTDVVYKPPLGKSPPKDLPFWRQLSGCQETPDARKDFHVYQCRFWSSCDGVGAAGVCLHKYGHILPKSWLPFALGRMLDIMDAPKTAATSE
ncbi:MAG: hypothetical protein KTR21_16255 [Rhodobacteraceae bacterium]|nr:hypothetical protein [Paracoccaceae bacterium]